MSGGAKVPASTKMAPSNHPWLRAVEWYLKGYRGRSKHVACSRIPKAICHLPSFVQCFP